MKHPSIPRVRKSSQYDHMLGNPLDPANHPSTNIPAPSQGAMFNSFQNIAPPSNQLDYDNTAD